MNHINPIVNEATEQKMSWEACISSGLEARVSKDRGQWALGDLAIMISTVFGPQSLDTYAANIGVAKASLQRYRTVADRFSESIREKFKLLSFSHFQVISSQKDILFWLRKAHDESWSVEKMRLEIKKKQEKEMKEGDQQNVTCPSCSFVFKLYS